MIRRIGWRRNGCGYIGQEFKLTEEALGRIRGRTLLAKLGGKI
jgi:hypothetical protein